MADEIRSFDDEMIGRMAVREFVEKLDPEIREILYQAYGEDMEGIPGEVCRQDGTIPAFVEALTHAGNVRTAKIILLRWGIACDRPMTLEEVAAELGITRERVRMIERNFYERVARHRFHLRRRKRLAEYLGD